MMTSLSAGDHEGALRPPFLSKEVLTVGEMADYYVDRDYSNMCFGEDDLHQGGRSYYNDAYRYSRPLYTLEQWINLQRGRPQDVFNDGFTDGT